MSLSLRTLVALSISYLLLPYGIFLAGYLRWPFAISIGLLACLGGAEVISTCRQASVNAHEHHIVLSKWHLAAALSVICLVMAISGVGGYGFQDDDWHKHNAILSALIRHEWPVAYRFDIPPNRLTPEGGFSHANVPLIYYIAYYLPAAMIGKLSGWFWANQALVLWTLLGICLAIAWFCVLMQRFSAAALLAFFLFSGADAMGLAIVRVAVLGEPLGIAHWTHIERWAGFWEYPAHITSMFWSPHQGIGAWIGCGLIVHELLCARRTHHLLFLLSLTIFWSPFVTLGFLPFLLGELWLDRTPVLQKLNAYFSFANLSGVVILGVWGLFYLSKFYPSPIPFRPVEKGWIFSSPIIPGFFWHEILLLLIVFCLVEVWGIALLIQLSGLPLTPMERRLFLIAVGILSLLPFLRYGYYNDLVMRTSLPALFLLAVFLTRAWYASTTPATIRGLIIILFLMGTMNVGIEVKRHLTEIARQGHIYTTPEEELLYDIPETRSIPSFFAQYVGSAESPFFTYLAKPLAPAPLNEHLLFNPAERTP